jgi:hypothetical protein
VKLTLPPHVVEAAVATKPFGRVSTSAAVKVAAVAPGFVNVIVAVLSALVSTCAGEKALATLGAPPAPAPMVMSAPLLSKQESTSTADTPSPPWS